MDKQTGNPEAQRVPATEYHVATTGDDANPGTAEKPFRTIQTAANIAQPGDTITVHAGTYRERVDPPRGGVSEELRITYQAAPGEEVVITGAEKVTGWIKEQNDTWKLVLPNSFFGNFNPYADVIGGPWYNSGRTNHTGAVYLNGDWLREAENLEATLAPADKNRPLWFGQLEETQTTLWAQFPNADPNQELTEINMRQAVFYPSRPGINYITVRGLTLRQAATPWAGVTGEQIGLIGTHWSKGWIIEDNIISHSTCTGITLGLRDVGLESNSMNYLETIKRAVGDYGWSKANIGSHIVRRNHISHCEKGGVQGSMGGAFSEITDNVIHDIHVRGLFSGCENAAIKLLGGIDTKIRGNWIYRCGGDGGIWLDWMSQGTRVTGNVLMENRCHDIYVEMNHGPFLIDHNFLLSDKSLWDMSQGGAYVHNLIAGTILFQPDPTRETPFFAPHSTDIAGWSKQAGGDSRFYNNLIVDMAGFTKYDEEQVPSHHSGPIVHHRCFKDGNAFFEMRPKITFDRTSSNQIRSVSLVLPSSTPVACNIVNSQRLGLAHIPQAPYVSLTGEPYEFTKDVFGHVREACVPGPFAQLPQVDTPVQLNSPLSTKSR